MFETSSPSGLMIKARQNTEMFFGEMEAENIETTEIKRQDRERREETAGGLGEIRAGDRGIVRATV